MYDDLTSESFFCVKKYDNEHTQCQPTFANLKFVYVIWCVVDQQHISRRRTQFQMHQKLKLSAMHDQRGIVSFDFILHSSLQTQLRHIKPSSAFYFNFHRLLVFAFIFVELSVLMRTRMHSSLHLVLTMCMSIYAKKESNNGFACVFLNKLAFAATQKYNGQKKTASFSSSSDLALKDIK